MLRKLVSVVAGLHIACSTPLDYGFAGHWFDSTTWASTGGAGGSYKGDLIIAVSGNTATVAQICLDGTGSVDATGAGDSAAWSGRFACPVIQLSNCGSVVITYTDAMATLTIGTPDSLTFVARGTAAGCSKSDALTVTWVAIK
jgi:hypothetical protein